MLNSFCYDQTNLLKTEGPLRVTRQSLRTQNCDIQRQKHHISYDWLDNI